MPKLTHISQLFIYFIKTGNIYKDFNVDLVSLGIFFHDKKIDLNFFIKVLCYSFYFFSGSCKEKCYHCWRRHEKNTNAGQAKERRKKNDGKLMLSKII
jgi:hypothetical protein